MAEVQDRHRKAAKPYACSDYGPDGAIGSLAQAIADTEAELADALEGEALHGQDPRTLARWVRSGEWRGAKR